MQDQIKDKATLLNNLTIIIFSRENTSMKTFREHDNQGDNNEELIKKKPLCPCKRENLCRVFGEFMVRASYPFTPCRPLPPALQHKQTHRPQRKVLCARLN